VEIRHSGLTSAGLGSYVILSVVTAFWEQLLFSGYLLRTLYLIIKNEWIAMWAVSSLFVCLHLPALLLVQHLGGGQLVLAVGLLLVLQMGCSLLRLWLKNLAAPMMAHALWGVTLYLFS
jgi:membrane protease YdiL (CAAX protease family)